MPLTHPTPAYPDRLGCADGVWRRQQAAECRAFAEEATDNASSADLRRRAEQLDTEADTILDVGGHARSRLTVSKGGEVLSDGRDASPFTDSLLTRPGMVAVDASRHRLSMASQAGVLALALDAAETCRAQNSLEEMLAHQIAAAHAAAMVLQAEAVELVRTYARTGDRDPALSVEATRLMNASARMMETTQRGVATLHRLRSSGQQTVIVQHVHVSEGGQAVVAGEVKARGRNRQKGSGG